MPIATSTCDLRLHAEIGGDTATLTANIPQRISEDLVATALAAGCKVTDITPEPPVVAPVVVAAPEGPTRQEILIATIRKMVLEGKAAHFGRTGDGVPKVAIIEELSGIRIGAAEAKELWSMILEDRC